MGVGYGARGIEARPRPLLFRCGGFTGKKAVELGAGNGAGRGGAGHGRHPYVVDACRRRGRLDFTLLALVGGMRSDATLRCLPPPTWNFPFPSRFFFGLSFFLSHSHLVLC